MNRAFGSASLRGNDGKELMSAAEWAPLVDITEDDKEFLIKADLAEVKKDDVKVIAATHEKRAIGTSIVWRTSAHPAGHSVRRSGRPWRRCAQIGHNER